MTERGHTLVELLFVIGLAVTAGGVAVPQLLVRIDEYRTAGAVRHLTGRIQQVRMEAVARSTHVGMKFVPSGADYAYRVYADGDGDGIRTDDIARSIDPSLGHVEQLSHNFAGVVFGLIPNLPPVEPGSAPPGSDPIKLGVGNLLSYAPEGTSSSGSVYVRGRSKTQYVIRVLGDTGRTRVLRFDPRSGRWQPS